MRDRAPQKKQRRFYSGKKKRHTIKAQILADARTLRIYSVRFAPGSMHDYALLKASGLPLSSRIELLADKGYVGIKSLHLNSTVPTKASKRKPLTEDDRRLNAEISMRRLPIEHINRALKRWRILSGRYRNKRRRFGLRFSLLCGIYNFQL